jgi:hypothetical protein
MEEKDEKPEPQASDTWVRVYPDQPPYQRLHLCTYLAELPELGEEDTPEEQSD